MYLVLSNFMVTRLFLYFLFSLPLDLFTLVAVYAFNHIIMHYPIGCTSTCTKISKVGFIVVIPWVSRFPVSNTVLFTVIFMTSVYVISKVFMDDEVGCTKGKDCWHRYTRDLKFSEE